LYLAIYGAQRDEQRTLVNIVPYALIQNLRSKDIVLNTEVTQMLTSQIEELEKKEGFIRIIGDDSHLLNVRLPETVRYVLSPSRSSRTRGVNEHKLEFGIAVLASIIVMGLTSLKILTTTLSDSLYVGLVGVTISVMFGAIGVLIRRQR
jgi:hypothetical protein